MAEGSSKGVTGKSLVTSKAALVEICSRAAREKYRQPVIVEEYFSGREFTVGVLGTGARCRALGTLEVVLLERRRCRRSIRIGTRPQWENIVRYGCSSRAHCAPRSSPSRSPPGDARLPRAAAASTSGSTARGRAQMLEVNPLAGLAPGYSDLPIMARWRMSFET